MIGAIIYIILGGLLARADGWGTDEPRWQPFAKFFNAFSCGGLFALATLLLTLDVLTSLAAGVAFIVWRAPGFNQWENWLAMFWRGLWTSAIGFTLVTVVSTGEAWGITAAPLMGAAQALCYSGGYKFLPGRIAQVFVHPVIEVASGLFFVAHVILLMSRL
jgi:hypothetical protein